MTEEQLREIWEDQAAFNTLFRKPPTNDTERAEQVKQFHLYIESELHELLRTMKWKTHRRDRVVAEINRAHAEEECADILKTVLSLFQIMGLNLDDLHRLYWEKTAVVRQRYREEWMETLGDRLAIIDIDNVLADYVVGFGNWAVQELEAMTPMPPGARSAINVIRGRQDRREFLSAHTVGLPDITWQALKHKYRTQREKRKLPVMPGASHFLRTLRERGYSIVLLTSRPIDRYPNLYTDTLLWLQYHDLPFDAIWWAADKGERILDGDTLKRIAFAVDDDYKYIRQYADMKVIPSIFWYTNVPGDLWLPPTVQVTSTFEQILEAL